MKETIDDYGVLPDEVPQTVCRFYYMLWTFLYVCVFHNFEKIKTLPTKWYPLIMQTYLNLFHTD